MSNLQFLKIESKEIKQCEGGRFREFSNKEIRIQCNCSFKCSSRNKVFKVSDKIPYYYNPEEFDGSEFDKYEIKN